MKNLRLTDSEMENYIDFTITAGEYHIREELKWLISVLKINKCNHALDLIRETAKNWEE